MDELRDMHSRVNSLEGVKEKYKKGVIENFQYIVENQRQITQNAADVSTEGKKRALRHAFSNNQYKECYDDSLGSNDRWGIVAEKNIFGLEADILPENEEGKKIVLRACSGRFQMQKFPQNFFPKTMDISNIRNRNENEQYSEIEEFYNMNNRQVFEKYGVYTQCGEGNNIAINLIANSVILDSLLQGRYSEILDIFCYSPSDGYRIEIKLTDGTEIIANSGDISDTIDGKKGITIKKDGKEARVNFDAVSRGEKRNFLTNINDLEVENVVYTCTGEKELSIQLRQAMQEQFKSQKSREDVENQLDEPNVLQEEKNGAQKIIEFMEQNNLEAHDLSLALSMVLARTTDKTNAEQYIINAINRGRENSEDSKSVQQI